MAPRRKRITPLGQQLRALRDALGLDQKDFGAMLYVSDRTVSRWENGGMPDLTQRADIVRLAERGPDALHDAIATSLGYELEAPPPPPAPPTPPAVVALPPAPPPAPPAPPPPSSAELRSALDAIVYAAAEERDVLPRHLRAFGVELLQGVARLGLDATRAAELVAVRERGNANANASASANVNPEASSDA